jgi:two-component system LytT family response regulator
MAERPPLRVLIVDDEPLGVERVRDLLQEQPATEVVGTAGDAARAVESIRSLRPDLVFLDIQMPGGTGLDVVRQVGPARMPATVFVTAYDQYALPAFDLAAVDYLVKPFDDERFEEAFRRARRRIELEGLDALRAQMLDLLQAGAAPVRASAPASVGAATPAPAARQEPRYLDRIPVRMRGKLRVVPVVRIDYITASGPYAELHVGSELHVVRESMQSLEERLDPAVFFRIHRSAIVRVELVEAILRGEAGDYAVQLKGGARLRIGRSRREALERRLGRR